MPMHTRPSDWFTLSGCWREGARAPGTQSQGSDSLIESPSRPFQGGSLGGTGLESPPSAVPTVRGLGQTLPICITDTLWSLLTPQGESL